MKALWTFPMDLIELSHEIILFWHFAVTVDLRWEAWCYLLVMIVSAHEWWCFCWVRNKSTEKSVIQLGFKPKTFWVLARGLEALFLGHSHFWFLTYCSCTCIILMVSCTFSFQKKMVDDQPSFFSRQIRWTPLPFSGIIRYLCGLASVYGHPIIACVQVWIVFSTNNCSCHMKSYCSGNLQ